VIALAGVEKLIEKIAGDAQHDAERYWQDAEDKKRALREAAERDIEAAAAQIERDSAEAIRENERRMTAVYDLEYRKQTLAAKQEAMGKAKDLAMEMLCGLTDAVYLALMKRKLLECAASGTGGIIVGKAETRLNEVFLKDANAELKKTAGQGAVTSMPERRDMKGGFIYVEGGMEVNMSLEAQLNEAWHDSETDVAKLLFD
jgi:V/A-type H+-transporting ATPase subunit E